MHQRFDTADPPALSELVAPVADQRRFSATFRAGFADCAPAGRLRLDGIARWLQEIAYADVEDAGLHFSAVWVVRRTRISVRRFPRFAEHQAATTYCGGLGRMWAERRTTIGAPDAADPDIEAVSLWVHLDPATWRPSPFSAAEVAVYGAGLPDRRISARLRHPAPSEGAAQTASWRFRAAECDLAGHVNNAAYLEVLEEELIGRGREPERLELEIEYRAPAQPGEHRVLERAPMRWIVSGDGELHASLVLLEA
jgi:acyl-ACP thioesterase